MKWGREGGCDRRNWRGGGVHCRRCVCSSESGARGAPGLRKKPRHNESRSSGPVWERICQMWETARKPVGLEVADQRGRGAGDMEWEMEKQKQGASGGWRCRSLAARWHWLERESGAAVWDQEMREHSGLCSEDTPTGFGGASQYISLLVWLDFSRHSPSIHQRFGVTYLLWFC